MSSEFAWLLSAYGYTGDAASIFSLAKKLEAEGNLHIAATAYDRAYGLEPNNKEIVENKQKLLDQLSVVEHGIKFRYIPAGSFLMGSESGDPDEQPVHPVELSAYWLSETPISWAVYCELMDWEPPPKFLKMDFPRQEGKIYKPAFLLNEEHKIRLQYCQDKTIRAVDWHAHVPPENGLSSHFGSPPEDPTIPEQYNSKPMVCISWQSAEELCQQISNEKLLYRLPTEAEWEKAARGGLINSRYPWGDEPPTHELCDFNRFDRFSILPMKKFAPNSYGLYSMSGCIWEWTSDYYDAEYYRESPKLNPLCLTGQQRVLRGGSWADCADAVTVSVRMSRSSSSWRDGNSRFRKGHYTPNIGFRLCRIVKCQVSEP